MLQWSMVKFDATRTSEPELTQPHTSTNPSLGDCVVVGGDAVVTPWLS